MAKNTFEDRHNNKTLAKINQIESAEGRPLSTIAVQGTQKFEWTPGLTIAVSVFAVAFVIALFAGYFIAPGGLLLVLGISATKPRRAIALSERSVSVWKQSMWSGSVNEVVVRASPEHLNPGEWTQVAGLPPVKLKYEEASALAAAKRTLANAMA